MDALIGLRGTVTVPISADKPGEVSLRCAGGTETYIAFSDQNVEVGAQVIVYETRGGQTVDVSPIGIKGD